MTSGMSTRALWLSVLLVAACGGSSGLPLDEVRDDAYGYAIRVPKGATQIEKEEFRHVWSWSPDQHVNSYSCIVQRADGVDEFTVAAAKARVMSVRPADRVTQAAPLGDDGLVVDLAEDNLVHYRESWSFRRGKTRTMMAICTGPAAGDTVGARARSLRVIE